jgi:ankyrin repeat protein
MLTHFGANINQPDISGQTPLHFGNSRAISN